MSLSILQVFRVVSLSAAAVILSACGSGGSGGSSSDHNAASTATQPAASRGHTDDTGNSGSESSAGLDARTQESRGSSAIQYVDHNFSPLHLPDGYFRQQFLALDSVAQQRLLSKLSDARVPVSQLDDLAITLDGGYMFIDLPSNDLELPAEIDATAAEEFLAGRARLPAAARMTDNTAASQTLLDEAEVFNLHSRPGANRTFYLDFDGHVIENTRYNNPTSSQIPFYIAELRYDALPFSIDDDFDNFSQQELRLITEVWEQISEDFAAFNVNVTTKRPASFNRYTGRILFTRSEDENGKRMPNPTLRKILGAAWPDVFGDSDYHTYQSPALVYTDVVDLYYSDRALAAAMSGTASHEIGHNLSLNHDGRGDDEYYSGHGSGKISWSSIMGNGNRNVHQWSIGEYAGATNQQDDLNVLKGHLRHAADDVVDEISEEAPRLHTEGNIIPVITPEDDLTPEETYNTGIIGLTAAGTPDVDVFEFDVGTGPLDLRISPDWYSFKQHRTTHIRGSNLDVFAEIYDADGELVATASESNDTFAAFTQTLPSGRYYLAISGESSINYSAYASQGRYYIHGSRPEPIADLNVEVNLQNDQRANNQTYELVYTVANSGPHFAGDVTLQIESPNDTSINSANADAMSQFDQSTGVWTVTNLCLDCTATLTVHYQTVDILSTDEHYIEVISSTSADPDSTPNSDTTFEDDEALYVVPVTEHADINLAIEPRNDTRQDNGEYELLYTLTNDGPNTANGLEVSLDIAAGMQRLSNTPSIGTSASGNTWTVPTLLAGSSATLTVRYRELLASTNDLTHAAELTAAATYDPDSVPDNQATNEDDYAVITLSSTIPRTVDLQLTSQTTTTETPTTVLINAQYTLTNTGEFSADAVSILHSYSSTLVITPPESSSSEDDSGYKLDRKLWVVYNLDPGESATLTFTGTQAKVLMPPDPRVRYATTGASTLEIIAADKLDVDSTPNNRNRFEDDMVTDYWSIELDPEDSDILDTGLGL